MTFTLVLISLLLDLAFKRVLYMPGLNVSVGIIWGLFCHRKISPKGTPVIRKTYDFPENIVFRGVSVLLKFGILKFPCLYRLVTCICKDHKNRLGDLPCRA